MFNPSNLAPIEDAFEAACYRAILKLVVPELRKIKDFKFIWPVETKRGGSDWTTCAVMHKTDLIAYLYGLNSKMVVGFITATVEFPVADPDVHNQVVKCVTLILDHLRRRLQK